MTTARQALKAGKPGAEWWIEKWWEVTSYISIESSHCVYPKFTDHRDDYFVTEEIANEYMNKIKERHPEHTVYIEPVPVLRTSNGEQNYLLRNWISLRKTSRLDKFGF